MNDVKTPCDGNDWKLHLKKSMWFKYYTVHSMYTIKTRLPTISEEYGPVIKMHNNNNNQAKVVEPFELVQLFC